MLSVHLSVLSAVYHRERGGGEREGVEREGVILECEVQTKEAGTVVCSHNRSCVSRSSWGVEEDEERDEERTEILFRRCSIFHHVAVVKWSWLRSQVKVFSCFLVP